MKKVLFPLVVLVAGFGVAALLLVTGPKVEQRSPKILPPLVRTILVSPDTVQLSVSTYGTVEPRTESDLVPEVSGRVIEISPSLVSGGFFNRGDVLLSIDPLDYEVALTQARAGIARAESDLANARKNHERQLDLSRTQATSASQRDETLNRMRIATATLNESRARLVRAQRDMDRTRIIAPYDGRVRSERVDIGQFVNRGAAVATIYAVDFAEVRLPIHDEELAYLDLPLLSSNDQPLSPIPVTLSAQFAGALHEWQGTVVRTEGELDPQTRMVNVIARVPSPYKKQPPLSVGLFVDAKITGTLADSIVVLPRSALRGSNHVYIVGSDGRLKFREVDVLRLNNEQVFVKSGIARNERVCISPLESALDGMSVRMIDQPNQAVAGSPD
jgi:RND family efflux transporter MFP subunit